MKYELSHDSIARQIFEKSSTESKARRKAKNFVARALVRFQERNILFNQEDIDEIKPFEHLINFTEAEEKFIRLSKQKLVAGQIRNRRITASIITLLSLFLLFALWQWRVAKQNAIAQKRIRLSLQAKEALEQGQSSIAFRLSEAAYHSNNDTFTNNTIRNTLNALYQNGLWADLQHDNFITSFDIAFDNQHIVSLSVDGEAKLWSADGKLITTLPRDHTWMNAKFSKWNDQLIALGKNGEIVFWGMDGQQQLQFQTGKELITFALHPKDALLLTWGYAREVSLYDWEGNLINELSYQGSIKNVEFSPDGKYILVATDELVEVRLLDFVRKKLPMTRFSKQIQLKKAEFVRSDQSNLETVLYTDQGLQFLDSNGAIDTISAYAFLNRQQETRYNSKIERIAYSSLSAFPKLLFIGQDSSVLVWSKLKKDINTGQSINNFDYRITKQATIETATFSATDRYCLIAGANKVVELLNLQSKKTWKRFHTDIRNALFSRDDHFFIAGNGRNTLKIWKMESPTTNLSSKEIIQFFSKRLRFLSDKEKERYQL